MRKSKVKVEPDLSTAAKVDASAFHDLELTREKIEKFLVGDLKRVKIAIDEVMYDKRIFSLLVDKYWERYQQLRDSKKTAPELDLNGNG